jgi:predicted PurR-regulated permease PerM
LALIVGVIITIVSTILGLPQPLLMGMLAAVLEFLPSVGHTIWVAIALIVALLEGSTTLPVSNIVFAGLVAGVHLAFTQFDLNFLIPRIIGREVNLHPMVVIIGLIIGASVGGVLGLALAAPAIATLRVLGRYIYAMLFDLDPFPMVGPPSAPKADRLAELERMQQTEAATPPRRRKRSRKSRRKDTEA